MMISEKIWSDFINILSEFGYLMRENIYNKENMRYVWEIIINIRENMKEEIEEAIRVNLNLCYFLEEDGQMKEINSELFKLNYVFDQNIYRFDNDSDRGLYSFHKIVISTYGNINEFINSLKLVNENISFIRKRKDQELIIRFNYLKKISLPVRGYEDLRLALLTLMKKFSELKILLTDPELFNEFINDIDIFINRYRRLYRVSHNNFQENLKGFYEKLYNLPEYKALAALSHIEVINVAYNLKPIKKYIETFFPEQCTISKLDDILDKNVKCSCGFNIGDTLTIPSLNKIKPMLKKGILEYIEKVQNIRFKPLFDNYLSYNNESAIKNFLEFKPDKVNGNIRYIDDELVKEINEALSNTYPLKIKLDELAPKLVGTYPLNQLSLIGNDMEKYIKEIIKSKIKGMEKINQEDIIINLVF